MNINFILLITKILKLSSSFSILSYAFSIPSTLILKLTSTFIVKLNSNQINF